MVAKATAGRIRQIREYIITCFDKKKTKKAAAAECGLDADSWASDRRNLFERLNTEVARDIYIKNDGNNEENMNNINILIKLLEKILYHKKNKRGGRPDDYSFELKIRDEKNELQTTNINFHTMMLE